MDNVVRTATQISTQLVNDVLLPQMERQMGTKIEIIKTEMRNEFDLKFQTKEEELVEKFEREKDELVEKFDAEKSNMEQKFNAEKETFKSEMQANTLTMQSELEEKLMNKLMEPEVFFQVIRKSGENYKANPITFDEATVNVGDSVNPSTGTFTANVNGLYFFTFSSTTSKTESSFTRVHVMKNNEDLYAIILDGNDNNGNDKFNNLNSSWMMRLQQGDQVYLRIAGGTRGTLFANAVVHMIWTGNLLKADA